MRMDNHNGSNCYSGQSQPGYNYSSQISPQMTKSLQIAFHSAPKWKLTIAPLGGLGLKHHDSLVVRMIDRGCRCHHPARTNDPDLR